MNRLKYRAWVRNAAHRLVPNVPFGTGSSWEEAWVMTEVLTIHLNKGKARCRYEKDGSFHLESGTVIDVHDYEIGEDCILMQWTGMRDKNNKDIYEGDIVLERGHTTNEWEVVWKDVGFFMVDAQRDGDEFGVYGSYLHSSEKGRTLEVVGNIHEKRALKTTTP